MSIEDMHQGRKIQGKRKNQLKEENNLRINNSYKTKRKNTDNGQLNVQGCEGSHFVAQEQIQKKNDAIQRKNEQKWNSNICE